MILWMKVYFNWNWNKWKDFRWRQFTFLWKAIKCWLVSDGKGLWIGSNQLVSLHISEYGIPSAVPHIKKVLSWKCVLGVQRTTPQWLGLPGPCALGSGVWCMMDTYLGGIFNLFLMCDEDKFHVQLLKRCNFWNSAEKKYDGEGVIFLRREL